MSPVMQALSLADKSDSLHLHEMELKPMCAF